MLTRRGRDAEDRAASKFRRRASFLRGFPSQTSRAPYYDFEFFRGKFPQSDSPRPCVSLRFELSRPLSIEKFNLLNVTICQMFFSRFFFFLLSGEFCCSIVAK